MEHVSGSFANDPPKVKLTFEVYSYYFRGSPLMLVVSDYTGKPAGGAEKIRAVCQESIVMGIKRV
jgi:hypothetical protein